MQNKQHNKQADANEIYRQAIQIVIDLFGEEQAKTVVRCKWRMTQQRKND